MAIVPSGLSAFKSSVYLQKKKKKSRKNMDKTESNTVYVNRQHLIAQKSEE